MVVKNVKNFEDLVLGTGKVLIKATERKSSILASPNRSGRADEAMQEAMIEYAEIVNPGNSTRFEKGDIVILANYSAPDSFAVYDTIEGGQMYIIMSEHSVYTACKPENYNKSKEK